jgi:hypothetical protein
MQSIEIIVIFKQSYQLNENCDLKTRTPTLKTHIFAKKKNENQPPNQKVVLSIAPFFLTRLKLQHFLSMAFKIHIVAQKSLKINT